MRYIQLIKYNVLISAGEGGSVSTAGGEFNQGSEISVTAVPQGEYIFKEWSDGNANATRTINVSSDITLTANFEKKIIWKDLWNYLFSREKIYYWFCVNCRD